MNLIVTWFYGFVPVLILVAYSSLVNADELATIKMSPTVRSQPLNQSIYTLDRKKLLPLLDNIVILKDINEYQSLPYIVGFEKANVIGSVGDKMFADNLPSEEVSTYSVTKPGQTLINPETKESLGLEILVVASAEVKQRSNLSAMEISSARGPVNSGDRLLPRIGLNIPDIVDVKPTDLDLRGFVVSIGDELYDVGNNDVVLVSLGEREGMALGDLLYLIDDNEMVYDPYTSKKVTLPGSVVGELAVISTFEKVSLAIVLKTERAISVNDLVITKDVA